MNLDLKSSYRTGIWPSNTITRREFGREMVQQQWKRGSWKLNSKAYQGWSLKNLSLVFLPFLEFPVRPFLITYRAYPLIDPFEKDKTLSIMHTVYSLCQHMFLVNWSFNTCFLINMNFRTIDGRVVADIGIIWRQEVVRKLTFQCANIKMITFYFG